MDRLVCDYCLELDSPGCVPGADRWSARAALANDIEVVLPYLNARLEKARYDQKAKVLIWKAEGHSFAFRPHEIKAAPARDREEAGLLIVRAISLINETWGMHDRIVPDYTKRSTPDLIQTLRLLPRNNCGRCGFATCMAFSAALRADKAALSDCVLLNDPEYTENRESLYELWGVSGR